MIIHQTTNLEDCEIKFLATEGSFSGYGSAFNVVDSHKDTIMPGAFADVIKAGNPVHVYVNHGWLRGELPVGKWNGLQEDAKGLFGDASLEMKMPAAMNAYWAVKGELVKGLSIGYKVDPSGIERNSDGGRAIHRIKALKEISIVDVGSNTQATITDVKFADCDIKSAIEEMETIRDLERFLRDVGSFDQAMAKAVAIKARDLFAQRDVGNDEAELKRQLVNRIIGMQSALSR